MRLGPLSFVAAATALAACSDTTGVDGPPPASAVSLSFSTRSTDLTGAPQFHRSASDTLQDGINVLVITKAEIVLREIELKRVEIADCDDDGLLHDECEEFETGPLLVDLPLDGSTTQELTVVVDTGRYDEIEFEIHKVSNDDPEDAAFRQAHPDMVGTSMRVQGSFNDQPFTFETDMNVEQEHDLVPPLVVDGAAATVNVTMNLDTSQWFVDGMGGLLNPQSGNKGGPNEGRIKENIKRSIEAFEDDDRDGRDDHS